MIIKQVNFILHQLEIRTLKKNKARRRIRIEVITIVTREVKEGLSDKTVFK